MMGSDFQFREKIPVAVLGATGCVGQRLVELLIRHPWFSLEFVAASERSVGSPYREAVKWMRTSPLPDHIGQLIVQPCDPQQICSLSVFRIRCGGCWGYRNAVCKGGSSSCVQCAQSSDGSRCSFAYSGGKW